ncbi:hypothetical protein HBB16_13005 [Pseudonocardia sp. MCCB 268]|nr:hypothetical protein [Pseudonocardia cytotoxica]
MDPVDFREDWLLDRELTGRLHWFAGRAPPSRRASWLADQWPTGRFLAPHGDFTPSCTALAHRPAPQGSWSNPTERSRPRCSRDPDALPGG